MISSKSIYLLPGHIAVVCEPAQISTILGSCVAIALQDRVAGISGLNHYLLPEVLPGEKPTPRYGNYSISFMIENMLQLGAKKNRLQAKIYGGANVLEGVAIGKNIGEKNVQMAEFYMSEMGIPVLEKNVGGEIGRKILFHTQEFQVLHKFMKSAA